MHPFQLLGEMRIQFPQMICAEATNQRPTTPGSRPLTVAQPVLRQPDRPQSLLRGQRVIALWRGPPARRESDRCGPILPALPFFAAPFWTTCAMSVQGHTPASAHVSRPPRFSESHVHFEPEPIEQAKAYLDLVSAQWDLHWSD